MWKSKDGLYSEEDFEKSGVKNFSSSAFLGDMKDEKNRNSLLKRYFGNAAAIYGEQVHEDNIKIVAEKDKGKIFPGTDGFITAEKGIILSVFTADCLPVFIFDEAKKIIGVVHAGRAGLAKFIIEKAIGLLIEKFRSVPRDVHVAVGPHICRRCYGKDLDALAEEQIKRTGVSPEKISNSNLCTYTGDFFSYRKNNTQKRILSAAMMEV